MPCDDGRYGRQLDAEREHKMTVLLCEAWGLLKTHAPKATISYDLHAWGTQHDREDAARVAREMNQAQEERDRAEILNSLTPHQRSILGFK